MWILPQPRVLSLSFSDKVRVAAGSNLLGRHNVTRWVRKIHLHPEYSTRTYDNDLALLLLEKPIPYSFYHSPLCLPDHSIVPDDNMWESCTVAGWGLTKAGEPRMRRCVLRASFPLAKSPVPPKERPGA